MVILFGSVCASTAMHVPPHPLWFWFVLAMPCVVLFGLWLVLRCTNLSLKPWGRWLAWISLVLWLPTFLLFDASGTHRNLRFIASTVFYTCWTAGLWIKHRYRVETITTASRSLYIPWRSADFSIPSTLRIPVRDISSVSPWYKEKLGLREASNIQQESESAVFHFKRDGNFVVLTTKERTVASKTPIFFSKKIERMRNILNMRGVRPGPIDRDRQGIRYFEIHDPEGNVIEVVEE